MKTALTGIPELPDGMMAELYTLTLADNTRLYYTTADSDIFYREKLYLAGVFNVERGTIKTSVGIDVDTVDITVYANEQDSLQGVSLPIFVSNGGFDGAWIKIERARKSYVVHLFEGMVTDANADRVKINLTLSAATVLLNVQMPRNLYSAGCANTLFDTGCGVQKADFSYSSSLHIDSDQRILRCGLMQAAGYFDLGTVIFDSGLNTGITRTVKSYTEGIVTLAYPLPHAVNEGDIFTIYNGCNGTRANCAAPFANLDKFRGFPFMPVPEASV